jgi:peptide/nickel transport system ATP-binding protein
MSGDPLLAVEDLRTHIRTDAGTLPAVDGVSFTVDRGETVCLVGESGSGKSVTCESLTGIVPQPPAEIVGGEITFDGTPLTDDGESGLRDVRGNRIAHVFQNPQGSLDPVYTVGEQIVEAIVIHRDVGREEARERGVELLREVGIPRAGDRFEEYPHEFSGGMRQRVAIAVALAADPDLLVADEPTTSVDVTVQARLIELLADLADGGTGLLWVTHDLRVVAAVADRVLVMFGGTIVERGPVEEVFAAPAHPYTRALFASYRGLPGDAESTAREDTPTDGCRFRDQCPHAVEACATPDQPPFHPVDGRDDHAASCVFHGPEYDSETVMAGARGVAGADASSVVTDGDPDAGEEP